MAVVSLELVSAVRYWIGGSTPKCTRNRLARSPRDIRPLLLSFLVRHDRAFGATLGALASESVGILGGGEGGGVVQGSGVVAVSGCALRPGAAAAGAAAGAAVGRRQRVRPVLSYLL